MLRIRLVTDDLTPANRSAMRQIQDILREQFSGLSEDEIAHLPRRLEDPLSYRFVSRLFVAEDGRERVRGFALLLYASDLKFCYLEFISTAPGKTGGGVGDALYQQLRDEARALGAVGIFLECLPDDPALSPDPAIRTQNAARLRFYERFGARPIANTAYETPLKPGDSDPPYLVYDGLGRKDLPARKVVQKIVRAILDRKYGDICPPAYVERVVESFKDDPIVLRPPRYITSSHRLRDQTVNEVHPSPLIVNRGHEIHHVKDRGYVEAPVRVSSIVRELAKTGLFEERPPRKFSMRHILAVHDARLVSYLERTCKTVEHGKSVYPYVFPIRNAARPPKDATVRAGYFCIDTFTPLNENAFAAARGAVDCALTAAEDVLGGARLAYALVRPPGHHAERKVFGGFCYFNNAAIAAHYLSRYGRVAVLDIDYHHGNGTQDIFYERADVLTVSIHGHPRFAYPYFSGFPEETGSGPGAGYNLNIALPESVTPDAYRTALKRALKRIADHRPAYLVLALGLDTASGDPTGTWQNRAADFDKIGAAIGAAGYRTLVVQEGGYRVRTLGTNARHFFTGFSSGAAKAAPGPAFLHEGGDAGDDIAWRESVRRADIERVRSLVAASDFFTADEIAIAAELVAERVQRGPSSGYEFVFAETGGRLVGYACYGPIPGTEGRFDLYWIVVDRGTRRDGLGRRILARVEERIVSRGGKFLYADTSGRDLYAPTRAFYAKAGFKVVSDIKDFYRDGDGKVIFRKSL